MPGSHYSPLSKPTGSGRAAGSWGSSLRTDGADRLEYRQGLESVQQCDGVLYISVCELPHTNKIRMRIKLIARL